MMRWLINFFTLTGLLMFNARLALPYIGGAVLAVVNLMALGAIALVQGLPQTLAKTTDEWLDKATENYRFPTLYAPQLYVVLWWVALLTVIIGWVLLTYLSLFILRLIF